MYEHAYNLSEKILFFLASGAGALALYLLARIQQSFDKIEHSVEQLNVKIAQIVEKVIAQEKIIEKHDTRLFNLETTNQRGL